MFIGKRRLSQMLEDVEDRTYYRAVSVFERRYGQYQTDRLADRTEIHTRINNATLLQEDSSPMYGGFPVVSVVDGIIKHLGLSLRRVYPGVILEKKGGPEKPEDAA